MYNIAVWDRVAGEMETGGGLQPSQNLGNLDF